MELSKDTVKKIMFLIVFTILVAVLLFNFEMVIDGLGFLLGVTIPFILGIVIAFILNMPMQFYERIFFPERLKDKYGLVKRMARPISLILSLVSVIGVIALVVFVVAPELYRSVMNLGPVLQEFVPKVENWILQLFPENETIEEIIASFEFNWEDIINQMIDFLKNGVGNVLNTTVSIVKNVVSKLTNFFIGFVFAIYILVQKEKLRVQLEKIMYAFLPEKVNVKIQEICSLVYRIFKSFLTGQCLEAVILGAMFFVVLSVIGFPYALLIGVLIAFTALIPILGSFIGCAISVFLIFMTSPVKALIFVAIFLVLQQIEGNMIYPKVVGNSVGLPSIWVLTAVSLGGSLMGVLGMVFFIPLVSVLYTLFREFVYKQLKVKGYFNHENVEEN